MVKKNAISYKSIFIYIHTFRNTKILGAKGSAFLSVTQLKSKKNSLPKRRQTTQHYKNQNLKVRK